jgi:hypothetical protein
MKTISDLKNNYGSIRYNFPDGQKIDTGLIKVGTFIGDHSKTGIGTLLTSGSSLGVCVNFHGGGMCPASVRSFSWGNLKDGFSEYELAKAIQTEQIVAGRRNITLSEAHINLLRHLYLKRLVD